MDEDKIFQNYDLLRASLSEIYIENLLKVMLWERGEGDFPFPISIHYDLTLNCSCKCVHCHQWQWPHLPELSIDKINQMFDIFKDWGIKTITLGGGNPLLHQSFNEVCKSAFKNDLKTGIVTEGALLSLKQLGSICSFANWIRFSLDGPDSKTHDSIRNCPGIFDIVLKNIQQIKDMEKSLYISLNCVVQKKNVYLLSDMIRLANQIGVDSIFFKIPHGEDQNHNFLLNKDEWKYFIDWLYSNTSSPKIHIKTNLMQLRLLINHIVNINDALEGRPARSFYIKNNIRCYAPLLFLVCDSQGFIYPCDYLQADTRVYHGKYDEIRNAHCLGNILDDKIDILIRLENLMRNKIHNYPNNGFFECGCCTRFCQLNAYLSKLSNSLCDKKIMDSSISNYIHNYPLLYYDAPFL